MRRRAFIEVGAQVYADLLFNWSDPIVVTVDNIKQLLTEVGTENVIIARRLTPSERAAYLSSRDDAEAERYAFAIPNDAARWSAPNAKKR